MDTTEIMYISQYVILGSSVFSHLIFDDANFCDLVEDMSIRSFHCKITFLSFSVITN